MRLNWVQQSFGGERRLVQFYMGTELWNNYNHIMLLDQNDNVVHKAWYTNDPMLNVSLIESEDPLGEWVPASWPTPGQPEPSTTSDNWRCRIQRNLTRRSGQ
ncbi:MAG: hypothetical protein CM15mP71_2260 [Candidatus Poseidoniales archaeon]|nr:MAG: hypothetical protein CM15mP71_2260 [Candidatus Poseidoniales archaeon]